MALIVITVADDERGVAVGVQIFIRRTPPSSKTVG